MSAEKAIEKLNKEAAKANSLGKVVAAAMRSYFKGGAHGADAGKVEDEKKTVGACASHIRDMARRKTDGDMAVMTDTEVAEAIKGYYGLSERPDMRAAMISNGEKPDEKTDGETGRKPMHYTPKDEVSLFQEEKKEDISGGKSIASLSLDDFF